MNTKRIGPCSVEGCETTPKSLGYCEKHYYRMRRTGTTDPRPIRVPEPKAPRSVRVPSECVVDGCEKASGSGVGYCKMHYSRVLRHGDPTVVIHQRDRNLPRGSEHAGWKGDSPTYGGAHMRVRAARGKASAQTCRCGRQAAQWAYLHNDPAEISSELGAYSADPSRYEAMCISFHKKADLARIRSAS